MDLPPEKKRRLDDDGSVASAWSEPLRGQWTVAGPEALHCHGLSDNCDVLVCFGMVSSLEVFL